MYVSASNLLGLKCFSKALRDKNSRLNFLFLENEIALHTEIIAKIKLTSARHNVR